MTKSTWSERNVTRPADGAGLASTRWADSSKALRNVSCTMAMSLTSIGSLTDTFDLRCADSDSNDHADSNAYRLAIQRIVRAEAAARAKLASSSPWGPRLLE